MNKKIEIYSLISGILFLISGMAKALSVSEFANLIAQYGFKSLQVLAPLIVLTEVLLGLLLIFQIRLKHTALACIVLVSIFTLAYAYGFVFYGIEDCGFFGKITPLNTSPVFTFIRNIILIYMLIVMWKKSENSGKMNKWILGLVLIVMSIVAFMSGYTYHNVSKTKNAGTSNVEKLENTVLKEFISTSKDSTYLVFAFTYSCPHCMNSIENLKQYESSGIVDKVIGIALEDSVDEQKFREIFNPAFFIKNYPATTLFRLTNSFPTAYYIRHDSIIAELSGELPCGYVFTEKIINKER
ncbi:MAG: hypothetical protein EZS26_001929 [Candidatus Ordinivivax streblomastigis]|uniref:Methylamine utilisation protein MauE domain-containing protein n=1 Tax=Candidatus Ordinivivax streblomastigis TaxID=2540710 RepID=A0A5M8P0Q4_9BACT|nr:MAG: hypothetical protein EZS26_001929 [Candidatus Ordinivivax streblomastigis]